MLKRLASFGTAISKNDAKLIKGGSTGFDDPDTLDNVETDDGFGCDKVACEAKSTDTKKCKCSTRWNKCLCSSVY